MSVPFGLSRVQDTYFFRGCIGMCLQHTHRQTHRYDGIWGAAHTSTCNFNMTIKNPPPKKLVLRFWFTEGAGPNNKPGGWGRTR